MHFIKTRTTSAQSISILALGVIKSLHVFFNNVDHAMIKKKAIKIFHLILSKIRYLDRY